MKIDRTLKVVNLVILCFVLLELFGRITKFVKWHQISDWQLVLDLVIIGTCFGVIRKNKIAMFFPTLICLPLIAISMTMPLFFIVSFPFILWAYCSIMWLVQQKR